MKLHLNLTLRRALLAAMAMVALHTADADMTPTNGHMYVTGEVSPTTEAWTEAWGSTTGVLSVGTSVGAGTLTLTSDNYTTPNSIFLGGKGYESNGSTASDGTLEIKEGATLTVNGSTNVGNSQIGGKGTLTLDDGTLNAGNALYVGVNAGSGTIEADGSTITVASGSTGAVFAMSHRTISAPEDTVTLTGSTITVGAKGGVRDYTSIGHSADTATLNLEAGSTATFHDQTIVGERGGSNGTIYVTSRSTLNLGTVTVLGAAAGANGKIYIEGDYSTLTADELVIGDKGTGTVEVTATANDDWKDTYTISAKEITLGESAGGRGTLSIGEAATVGKITNLRVGREGIGTLTTEADIETDTLAIAQSGSSVTVMNYSTVDTGYLAILGGTLNIATVDENGDDTVYSDGSVNVSGATYTDAGSTINIAVGGEFTTQGGSSEINGETIKETVIGGKVNINGSRSDNGDFSYGSWNANGSTTMLGTLTNNGVLNVGNTDNAGSMAAMTGITGIGTTKVAKGSELQLTGAFSQNEIDNDGSITLQGAGRIDASTLSGTGTTTITIDGTTVSTSEGLAIIEVGTLGNGQTIGQTIKVDIDTDNGASLVGKTFNFVEVNKGLINLDQNNFNVDEGWTIDWDGNNIFTGDTSTNGQQLSFTGGTDSMTFTKLGAIETKQVEVELPANVTIELEVVTETVLAVTVTPEQMGTEVVKTDDAPVKVENDTIIHAAEISQGVDKDTQEEVRTNVVIGKDVTSNVSDSGSIKVQSVVVNQKTTVDGGHAGSHDDTVKKETLGVSGVALVLSGESHHTGTGMDNDAHLGFNEDTKEGTLTVKDKDGNIYKNEVKKLDLVSVEEQSVVSITDMNMHSTHALTVASGTTITFNSVNLHVGGTTDVNLTEDVEVKVYDEQGNVTGTKIETVDTGAHLTVDSTITKATVKITGGSAVTFEKIDDKDHHSFGSTTFKESEVEIDSDSSLGDNAEHMQEIVFTGETSVKNSGNVNNAKFDEKSKLHNDNGTVDNVVISNGSHLTGKGNLKKVHVDKDSYLTVGSSPGKFTADELTVDGKTSFYIITDSNEWDSYTGNSSQLTATERQDGAAPGNWGAISQLVVDGSVTLNGQVTFIYQHFDDATGEFVTEDTATAREEMKQYFKEGSSIKFVDFGQNGNLTLGSNFSVDLDSLPELEDGLFWDVNSLFTENTVYVMAEILEEPTRVANSLVSAGETVLNFGRLAEAQASLREAGTTRTWGSAIAMFDSIDSGSTTNGYDYSNWGAAVGIDHAFTKNTVVGVAFGCTWGENEAKEDNGYYSAGSIDQDAKMIGIYGVHKFQTKGLMNDVKLSAFAAYGMFENDSTRNGLKSGNTAKAEWDSDAWVLSASLSRDITTDSGVVFTPYVGVEYTTAGMDDFSEQGKSYAADYSADEDYSNLSVKVGVGVSKTYGSITPYANVAFISDIDRTAGEVTATGKRTITGKSALPGRNGFEIGVGATWQLTENLDVNAGYSAEIRDKATEHNARLGVGYTF